MKKLLFIIVAAIVCSCSALEEVSYESRAKSYSYSEYRTISPSQTAVYTYPLMADLVVGKERIKYAERINQNITTMTDAQVNAMAMREKEVAIANALVANNADVLVAPMVNITTDTNKNLVIVVCGYPAVYKNFRNITKNDTWIVEQNEEKKQAEKKTINITDSQLKIEQE